MRYVMKQKLFAFGDDFTIRDAEGHDRSDTYGVDVTHGGDDVLILACTVVIDMCSHDDD